MWRWLLIIFLAIVSFLALPVVVSADTSQDVTVTAIGYICEAPGGFTVTYISDYEVGLSWTKGVDAENTMVRACIGRYPEDREDGYLVYYGDGTSATDWVNMEFLSVPIYYQAWSERADGIWEEGGSDTGWVEGVTIMLFALLALSLGLLIAAYVFKRGALFFGAAGGWLIGCIFCYTRMTGIDDIYFYLCLLCAALLIVSVIGSLTTRETRSVNNAGEVESADAREAREYMEETLQQRNGYSYPYNDRKNRRRLNRY